MQRKVTLYGLTFSLPLLLWQVVFFVFPMAFMIFAWF